MSRNLYFEDELSQEKFNGFMLKRLIKYAGTYKAEYIKVIVMLIATSFLSLIPAAINMYIIENILPQNGVVMDDVLWKSIIMLTLWISLSVGAQIAGYITSKLSSRFGNAIVCNLREDLFKKLMELSFDYYDNRPTGKILVRVTNYTDEIAGFFINDMTRVVENVFIMLIIEWTNRTKEHQFQISIKYKWLRWTIYLIFIFMIFLSIKVDTPQFIYFQF